MTECSSTAGVDSDDSDESSPAESGSSGSASGSPAVEWRHDATSSRLLRLLAHGFVAGLGGPLMLLGGALLLVLPSVLPELGIGPVLFVALLVLVGGPLSLLYLWPMLADPEQRPSPGPFAAERLPWTATSTVAAALAGAVLFGGLGTLGVPFDALFAFAVVLVFSPVVVNLFSTVGRVEGDRLVCNGREIPLSQVVGVRSVRAGGVVVCWVSYARGIGALAPRFLTIPAKAADDAFAALEGGVDAEPAEFRRPDPAVRLVLGGAGLLFVGVAVVAARAATDPVVGTYLGGVLGLVGLVLCVAGWRGV